MKRRRSTFRRGGGTYGLDGRNKVGRAHKRRQDRRQSQGQELPPEPDWDRWMPPEDRARVAQAINAFAEQTAIGIRIFVDELHRFTDELEAYIPREVDAEVVGMTGAEAPGQPAPRREPAAGLHLDAEEAAVFAGRLSDGRRVIVIDGLSNIQDHDKVRRAIDQLKMIAPDDWEPGR